MVAKKFAYMAKQLGKTRSQIFWIPAEVFLRSSTGTPVSDAVKFNMADWVHRLSLTASLVRFGSHVECRVQVWDW